MEVNIYNFDKTIYKGHSMIDFYLFCLKKKKTIIKYFFFFVASFFLYISKLITQEEMKEKLFAFLRDFDNIDELVEEFWTKNNQKIKNFNQKLNYQKDIIISSAPEFFLKPITKKLKPKALIATKVDKKTGKYISKNCSEEEIIKRLNKYDKNLIIKKVYTANYKNLPLLLLANECYIVKKNTVTKIDKEILKDKNKKIIDKIKGPIFILSNSFLPLLLIDNILYTLPMVSILFFLNLTIGLVIYYLILEDKINKINKRTLIVSIFISLYIINNILRYSYQGQEAISILLTEFLKIIPPYNLIKVMLGILCIPSITIYIYILIDNIYPYIKKEYLSLNNTEKKLLIITTVIFSITTIIIYNRTNAFYMPIYNDKFGQYDVIYTSDTGQLNKSDAFIKISATENDIRQPLFGLFSMPFALLAKFISIFLSFIPHSYYIAFNIIQIILLTLSIIMISRLICNSEKKQALFFLLSISTYSFILFSFLSEQYIISTFYLILTIYVWYKYKPSINNIYICSLGTMLTSGVILPMITKDKPKFNIKYLFKIIKIYIYSLIIMITTGQIITFSKNRIRFLLSFTGVKVKKTQCIKQFLYFIRTIIIAPNNNKVIFFKKYPCYRLETINNYSIIGIVILVLCIISFIVNHKKIFAKISFLWIIYSFVILCLIGWGTKENGLILYSLYFSWAYISLLYMLICNIKNKKIKIIIIILLILIIHNNLQEFINLLHFCLKYYRV